MPGILIAAAAVLAAVCSGCVTGGGHGFRLEGNCDDWPFLVASIAMDNGMKIGRLEDPENCFRIRQTRKRFSNGYASWHWQAEIRIDGKWHPVQTVYVGLRLDHRPENETAEFIKNLSFADALKFKRGRMVRRAKCRTR